MPYDFLIIKDIRVRNLLYNRAHKYNFDNDCYN